jgi:ATP-dependent Lhr-like helicase
MNSGTIKTRRADTRSQDDLGTLDPAAIERVRDEARPDPRDADELHDALMVAGFLRPDDLDPSAAALFEQLTSRRRASVVRPVADVRAGHEVEGWWVAAERLVEMLAIHPGANREPAIVPPPSRADKAWDRDAAIVELVRGRLTIAGPATAHTLAALLAVAVKDVDAALLALETEGVILRGRFTPGLPAAALEWCDRTLLARIHRYTLNRLRAEIEPVTPAALRSSFKWQHVDKADPRSASTGCAKCCRARRARARRRRLGEEHPLARVTDYDSSMLDGSGLAGRSRGAAAPAAGTTSRGPSWSRRV